MIPLVRARYSDHFLQVVRESRISIDQILDSAGLNETVFEISDGLTSHWQLGEVARASALRTDNLDIGWHAAEKISLNDYGSFSNHLFNSTTLYQRLNAFCAAARIEYSGADFRVESLGKRLLFKRGPIEGDELAARQTELYVLSMMINTVRSMLGQSWTPRQVSLQTFYRSGTENHFDTNRTDLRFDQRETVVVIEGQDAVRSLDFLPSGGERIGLDGLAGDVPKVLGEFISANLGDQRLSVDWIARICGLHPRKLQRELTRNGTTFSQLLAQQRVRSAVHWLRHTDMPIAEISYMLGYTHQAHFSRAFRQFAGVSPIEYRRMLNSN